jgi:hypothetical protein
MVSEKRERESNVHGFQHGAVPGGVAGRAGGELMGGGAHLAHDVVDPPLDVVGEREGSYSGGIGVLEEPREAAQAGHRVAGLPHHVLHRRRRCAVEPALPVVQHGAPDAARRGRVTSDRGKRQRSVGGELRGGGGDGDEEHEGDGQARAGVGPGAAGAAAEAAGGEEQGNAEHHEPDPGRREDRRCREPDGLRIASGKSTGIPVRAAGNHDQRGKNETIKRDQ